VFTSIKIPYLYVVCKHARKHKSEIYWSKSGHWCRSFWLHSTFYQYCNPQYCYLLVSNKSDKDEFSLLSLGTAYSLTIPISAVSTLETTQQIRGCKSTDHKSCLFMSICLLLCLFPSLIVPRVFFPHHSCSALVGYIHVKLATTHLLPADSDLWARESHP
jgi:hypothetical protein